MTRPDEVEVVLDTATGPVPVGVLRPSFTGGRSLDGASFEYDPAYLGDQSAYALSPDLPLRTGRTYTPERSNMFGAFADASPDEWGQKIIQANHAVQRKRDPSLTRRIGDFDYLLGVSDRNRMGALRFRRTDDPTWLSSDAGVANMHDLERILEVTRRYESKQASDADVEYLAGIATSPGGARPKANVLTQDGHLALAKLPHSKDHDTDVEAWEAVATEIARNAGLRTSPFQLYRLARGHAILVTERFDRTPDGGRTGFISAATALGTGTHDTGRNLTYIDLADTITELTDKPAGELRELFGRIALTVLVNNVDDHWRNHGFLRGAGGWQLSPIFDVNPNARRGSIESRPISEDDDPRDRDIRVLLRSHRVFSLSESEAASIIRRVAREVRRWPEHAKRYGIPEEQRADMAVAFDEEQLVFAENA